jgi:hypothetical protein
MKQILMALAITAFAWTGAEAQTQWKCVPVTPKHKTAVKHKTVSTKTTETVTACKLVPYQVCAIMADRQHVSCYTTTDGKEQTPTGPTTVYGPTGPMPGDPVKFNVRTVVVKGKEKGSYCRRNAANNATECFAPGYLLRDEDGYYSYSVSEPPAIGTAVTAK